MPDSMWQTLRRIELARQAAAAATATRSRAALRGHLMRRLRVLPNHLLRGIKLDVKHKPGRVQALVDQVDRIPGMAMRAARQMAGIVRDKCIEYTNVEYFTLQELAMRGHPYATRRPIGSAGIPDWIVNLHRGDYAEGWEARTAPMKGGARAYVVNTSRVAKYLRGTTKMRPRKTVEAARAHTKDQRVEVYRDLKRELGARA